MKKKSLVALFLVVFGACIYGVAQDFHFKSLGFIIPQINNKSNVYSPATGEIVYDSSDSTFYGRTQDSAWVAFGGGSSVLPSGTILPFAGTTAPAGFFLADGSLKDRTTYGALFAAIGSAYGAGDGENTFNIPDLRGRFLRGVDGAAGNDPDKTSRTAMAAGGNTGNSVGSIQGSQLGSHNHGFYLTGGGSQPGVVPSAVGSNAINYSGAANATLASGGNETRPVNAYVNYIIKY